MALGSSKRDYTTEARATRRRMEKHFELMNQYIKEGMTREEASKKAYDEVIKMKINGRKGKDGW